MANSNKIVAIVVAYCPDVQAFINLLEATSPQVDEVVVVDNTPNPNLDLLGCCTKLKNLNLISLGDNFGIAYAHNKGIEWARDAGADYVLLLDQDSIPSDGMVSKLLLEYARDGSSNEKVAAVGPATHDKKTNLMSYFIVSRCGFPFRFHPNKNQTKKQIRVGFLISSGSLISLSALDKIGGKRESYFIDHVDTEWCFRARHHGFKLVGVHDAVLHHQLGDKIDKFWAGYVRHVPHHTPLRDYYMFRNTLLMLSDVRIPVLWQAHLILRLLQFVIYFLIFANHRLLRLRLMSLGLFHGFKGIRGRLDINNYTCSPIPKVSSVSR